MKQLLRKYAPRLYKRLCAIKDYLIPPQRFGNAYDGEPPYDKPEPSMWDIAQLIPSHVDTMLDVGCASGRNFIPFVGKLKLHGIDIVPRSRIKFVPGLGHVTYWKMTIEDFTRYLETVGMDLTHTFVHSHSSIGYVNKEWQTRFYGACMANGCRNFHFEEYPMNPASMDNYFKLDERQFTNKQWRKTWKEPHAHYRFE